MSNGQREYHARPDEIDNSLRRAFPSAIHHPTGAAPDSHQLHNCLTSDHKEEVLDTISLLITLLHLTSPPPHNFTHSASHLPDCLHTALTPPSAANELSHRALTSHARELPVWLLTCVLCARCVSTPVDVGAIHSKQASKTTTRESAASHRAPQSPKSQ